MISETLLCSDKLAALLSQLVFQKTQGNPFFTTQFLKGLHAEGCIAFQVNKDIWQCDLAQVRQLALTDDVVEFIYGRTVAKAAGSGLSLLAQDSWQQQYDLTLTT